MNSDKIEDRRNLAVLYVTVTNGRILIRNPCMVFRYTADTSGSLQILDKATLESIGRWISCGITAAPRNQTDEGVHLLVKAAVMQGYDSTHDSQPQTGKICPGGGRTFLAHSLPKLLLKIE